MKELRFVTIRGKSTRKKAARARAWKREYGRHAREALRRPGREQEKAGDKMRDLTETRSRRALQVILRALPLTVDKMRRHHNVAIREQHDLTYFNRITLALLVNR